MFLLSMLLLAAAASADSLIIGFNYGVKGVRIGRVSNCFISLVCFAGTYCSMLLGQLVGCFLESVWAQSLGGAMLVLLGLWMLCDALHCPNSPKAVRKYSENPSFVDKDSSKIIELRESLMIGLVLCMNNVGLGIGGGMAGIPILLTSLACAASSFLFIGAGCMLGRRLGGGRLAGALEIAAAGLILALGIGELLAAIF